MYTSGFVIIYDQNEEKRKINCSRAMFSFDKDEKCVPDSILLIKAWPILKMEIFKYHLSHIIGMYTDPAHGSKVALKFKPPNHFVIFDTLVCEEMHFFIERLSIIMESRNQKHMLNKNFQISFDDYLSIDGYIRNDADINHLSTLILENCIVPSLAEHIRNSPISHLSLTGSTLGTTQIEKDTFWNWMSIDIICNSLQILEMNSINLSVMPFEIKYLKNLQILSVANNNLIRLPHCIGELKNLEQFFINNNKLNYLPGCLHDVPFKEINISENNFKDESDQSIFSHLFMSPASPRRLKIRDNFVVKSLIYFSLFSLVDNSTKFKRQDIPYTLLHFFDEFTRCELCHKCVIPDDCIERYSCSYPMSSNFNKNIRVTWQYFECRVRCYRHFIYRLYDEND